MPVTAESTAAKVESASERAYRWTRQRILDATFPPDSMISEGEIAELVGVSRTPVREAFLRLANEGFLRLYPKRGAIVVPVTVADMREIIQARYIIEPWAAGIVAGLADRELVAAQLTGQIGTLATATRTGDAAAYQEADRAFHLTILEATTNRLLIDFYQGLRDRQLRVGAAALVRRSGAGGTIIEEHEAIAEAIADGASERAADAARTHVLSTGEALRQRRDDGSG